MYILECCYPLTPVMDRADIFIGLVREAHQQLIDPAGLHHHGQPFPARSAEQGQRSYPIQQQPRDGCQRMAIKRHQSWREGAFGSDVGDNVNKELSALG